MVSNLVQLVGIGIIKYSNYVPSYLCALSRFCLRVEDHFLGTRLGRDQHQPPLGLVLCRQNPSEVLVRFAGIEPIDKGSYLIF